MRTLPLLLIVLVLAACGGDKGSSRPPEGGATPKDVAERLAVAIDANRYADVLALIPPARRAELTYGLAVVGPMGQLKMREAFLSSAEAAGPQAVARMTSQIAAMRTAHERILEKYDVPRPDLAEAMRVGADPEKRRLLADAALEGTDLYALLQDVDAMTEAYPDGRPAAGGPFKNINYRALTITESGDTARGVVEGALTKQELGFVRIEGRWYAELLAEK
jgi:hypothetical protein